MKKTSQIIVITGPTASGKTALAIKLAKKMGAQIICADSRIIYKDLNIVSAKPTTLEKEGVLHHLIDIKTVNDGIFSAGEFVRRAKEIIKNAKCPVIIQGGTWFYIKSLLDKEDLFEYGQNELLRAELSSKTNDELYEILKSNDPVRASLIHKNNRDKVIRSIELIKALGSKLSETKRPDNIEFSAKWFMPNISREHLYERINLRVDKMLEDGLYEEFEAVCSKYGKNDILYNTIGYKEFFDLKDGLYPNYETAVEKIKQHTRNFAKRQLTWFRQNEEKFLIKKISSVEEII